MDRKSANRISNFLHGHLDEQLELLRSLVRLESPSTEPGSQRPILNLLAEFLEDLDFRATILRGRHSGGRLFALPRTRLRGAPGQLLLGHCDTVWPTGTLETMPLETDGAILRGPGVFDMKAGLSQVLGALRALRELGIPLPVTPIVYVSSDEELGSEDSRYNIQWIARRVVRVLIPEPASGPEGLIKTTRKGVGLFTIRVTGREAHAGLEPESGVSAIFEMSRIIQEVSGLNDSQKGVSVTVGTVRGGTRPNVVPAEAVAEVDVRASTLSEARKVETVIRGLVPHQPGAAIHVEGGIDRPPLEPTARNRRLWEQARSCATLLDIELGECESGGASDGNLTSPFAATLDGLGSVGGGAHARHEFIRIDRLAERTALLALLIAAPPNPPN